MKANYTKPLLAMELFSLTQSVARDCNTTHDPNNFTSTDPYGCELLVGTITVFIGGKNCMIDGQNGEFGCYHNPEGNLIFRS